MNDRVRFLVVVIAVLGVLGGSIHDSYGQQRATWTLVEPARGTETYEEGDGEKGGVRPLHIHSAPLTEGRVQPGDTLAFELFDDVSFRAPVRAVDRTMQGTTVARGAPVHGASDFFSVSYHAGRLYAVVAMGEDGAIYEVRYDAARDVHVVERAAADYAEACGGGLLHEEAARTFDPSPDVEGDEHEPATIDVMVMYTLNAEDWAFQHSSGIENVVSQAMSLAQEAIDNSDVNITLRLVYSGPLSYAETGNSSTDLQRLTAPQDGYMDDVHALRDEYGADLVALFTETNDVGGIAWILGSTSGWPSSGFSVTRVQQAATSFTHAHEMGHNMGNAHSRNQQNNAAGPDGGLFEYSTGWRWTGTDGNGYTSVMTYPEGDMRAPVFSNPDVEWEGMPSGAYDGAFAPADNARNMREIKHVVASYRGSPVQPPVLEAGEVSPLFGTPRDAFTFAVRYQSDEGVAPENVRLHLDGTSYNLTSNSFDWEDGVEFSTQHDALDVGTYEFYFSAEADGATLREPEQGTYTLEVTTATVEMPLTIRNGASTQLLSFGLDPAATDGIDPDLGEDELPPFPDPGTFAARFVGDDLGTGSHRDYRTGDRETDAAVEHELRFQAEDEAPVVIGWELPNRVTGRLTDLDGGERIDAVMEGTDSLSITDSSIQRLRMTVTYALGGNQPPVVDRVIGNRLVQAEGDGLAARLDTVFSDPDGDPLSYRVDSSDPNVAEGAIEGMQLMVTPLEAGSASISVWADDGRGGVVEDRFAVTVNTSPAVLRSVSDVLLQLDDDSYEVGLDSVFVDPDGDSLRYRVEVEEEVVGAERDGETVRVTPQTAGETTVRLAARDGRGGSAMHQFVAAVNVPPALSRSLDSLLLQVDGAPFVVDLDTLFTSPSNNDLAFSVDVADGEVIELQTKGTTLTAAPLAAGTTSLKITATDDRGGKTDHAVPVIVNTPPTVVRAMLDRQLTDEQNRFAVDLDTVFADADGDDLTYAVRSTLPAAATGTLSGATLRVQGGTSGNARLIATAHDPYEGVAVDTFATIVRASFDVDVARSFGATDENQNYRLVALPGRASRSIAGTVDGAYGEQWRAFWDNGQPGAEEEYLVEHNDSEPFHFQPGMGFWLISEEPWTVSDRMEAVALTGRGQYEIPLHDGWNIIANPFDEDVPWRTVQRDNDVTETLWQWNGAFNETATFASAASGTAYYFFNDPASERSVLRIPYPAEDDSEGNVRKGDSEPAITVDVEAHVDGDRVSRVRVGRAADARSGADSYRRVAPPGHFQTAVLTVDDPALPWGLAQTFRPTRDREGHPVGLLLQAPSDEEVVLRAHARKSDPTQQAVLRRDDTGATYSLPLTLPIQTRTGPGGTAWTLFVGNQEYVNEHAAPQALELHANHPNPFNERTTIEYALPEAMDVRLDVYNVLGQRVAVLVDASQKDAGFHRVQWNGRSSGSPLASGVYFVRLRAEGKTRVEQVTLVR